MKTLEDQLSNYAAYHRDRRNIATHFVGIPMIVVGIATFLARPSLLLANVTVSPATVAVLGTVGFYLALDRRFGVVMAALMGLALWAATSMAAMSTGAWLAAASTFFIVGWAIQFVGHAFEGRKPAFVDDLIGLLVGPLFVVAEVGFALGLRTEVRAEIERRAGPTLIRQRTPSAAR